MEPQIVQKQDPKKIYINVKHAKVIGILIIVVVVLSAALSIISYVK